MNLPKALCLGTAAFLAFAVATPALARSPRWHGHHGYRHPHNRVIIVRPAPVYPYYHHRRPYVYYDRHYPYYRHGVIIKKHPRVHYYHYR